MDLWTVRVKKGTITNLTYHLHKTLIVCVETTFSVSCMLMPWQITTRLLLLGSTMAVMLEVVIQPPSGDTIGLEVAFLTCLPATIHLISAGGLLLAVVHVRGTGSPTLASVGPEIVTWAGETENSL